MPNSKNVGLQDTFFSREQLQSPPQIGFAKVEVQAKEPAGTGIRIALSHHVHIDIPPDFDESTLRRVLSICI